MTKVWLFQCIGPNSESLDSVSFKLQSPPLLITVAPTGRSLCHSGPVFLHQSHQPASHSPAVSPLAPAPLLAALPCTAGQSGQCAGGRVAQCRGQVPISSSLPQRADRRHPATQLAPIMPTPPQPQTDRAAIHWCCDFVTGSGRIPSRKISGWTIFFPAAIRPTGKTTLKRNKVYMDK